MIILLIAGILIGAVIKSKRRAQYARWMGYSRDMRMNGDAIAYYAMDGIDGAKLENLSLGETPDIHYQPDEFDGTINGATVNTNLGRWPGKTGISFDGVDDHVALGLNVPVDTLQALTVMAWVRPRGNNLAGIVSLDGTANWSLMHNGASGETIWNTVDGTGGSDSLSGGAASEDGWVMLIGRYDKAGTIETKSLFHDNNRVAGNSPHIGQNLGEENRFGFLGAESRATEVGGTISAGSYFEGEIDEVLILNSAATASQVRDFYRMGRP